MGKAGKKSRKPVRRKAKSRHAFADIPNKASIVARDTLTMPDGSRYTVLETDQRDPYDPPATGRRRRRR
jgi:hypothetical protein